MFVIVDLEWVELPDGRCQPTQLAAARVDVTWTPVDAFSALIRPESRDNDWKHMAFSGADPDDFLCAPNASEVFPRFNDWLLKEDVLCWWSKFPAAVFDLLMKSMLDQEPSQQTVIAAPYFTKLVRDRRRSSGNPYALAHSRNLPLPSPAHAASNDVAVLCQLFAHVKLPQDALLLPLPADKLCPTIAAPASKEAIRERNADIVARSIGSYFFFKNSPVFHTGNCPFILNARHPFHQAGRYNLCISHGRTPCKRCKPVPLSKTERNEKRQASKLARHIHHLAGDELAAYTRYAEALEARERIHPKGMNAQERDDRRVRTSSFNIFFAGKESNLFHLPACPELSRLSEIHGYARYDTIIRAGYQPCPQCAPTKQHDLLLSIPITSRFRGSEPVDALLALCAQKRLRSSYQKPILSISTPVAAWRMNIKSFPIILEHKPLQSEEYHRQHRMFLSFADAIRYIAKHDRAKQAKAAKLEQT